MTTLPIPLPDDGARRMAIATLDKSLLVEAGAGSGKTAVMAGRVAMLLACGVPPREIAAITFTELAAGELLQRIREFAAMLAEDRVPAEMRVALPAGLTPEQREHVRQALISLDELACSTIHGFCQKLIKPYPVEANIDPGATVMDGQQAQQVFDDLLDQWLWTSLETGAGALLATLISYDADAALALLRAVAAKLRHATRDDGPDNAALASAATAFQQAASAFASFVAGAVAREEVTCAVADGFGVIMQRLHDCADQDQDISLARCLVLDAAAALLTKEGSFKAFQVKGKWRDAVKTVGLKNADGDTLAAVATGHHSACKDAWLHLKQLLAGQTLTRLSDLLQPVLRNFERYKRDSALLDFDDLILAARALLRDHEVVRHALGARYRYVLVDEFQDTDPLQSEILWRLCGDPVSATPPQDWAGFAIRPGALFLVGDPKQAIYRFRGADIAAYTRARQAFADHDRSSVLSISTNFRSRAAILAYANRCFAQRLAEPGQPGFIALEAFRAGDDAECTVMALDVEVDPAAGQGAVEAARHGEAHAVAALCAQLIGAHMVPDRRSGESRPCRPGDIALLAPMGTELWRYEVALERLGIPVASQAGKGFYRRQEVQDLVALTRVLADSGDTVAFGALLRGPLVGLTEQELLDIVWDLPRDATAPDRLVCLDLNVDPAEVSNELARSILTALQALRRMRNQTTPHLLLSRAIDALHVRAIVLQRHQGKAERALANIDQYLAGSRDYAVRGIVAFAAAMSSAWEDEAKAAEGQPDAREDAVTLSTVHAAKGLEWPVVVPINMMTKTMVADSVFVERASGVIRCRLFGTAPSGYDQAHQAEEDELARERIRLWYVALTRARDLLVLPRLNQDAAANTWARQLDLALPELPQFILTDQPLRAAVVAEAPQGATRAQFAEETARICAVHRTIAWLTPSRDEGALGRGQLAETPQDRVAPEPVPTALPAAALAQGGMQRGLVIHKLLEEVLSSETSDDVAALNARAIRLIAELGEAEHHDAGIGLSAQELAQTVYNTLALPQIAALRPSLLPEFHVYGGDGVDLALAGIADAIGFGPDGAPEVIVDWKSDVAPSAAMLAHYRDQVGSYMGMTGATRGLIVLVTSGTVIEIVAPAGV